MTNKLKRCAAVVLLWVCCAEPREAASAQFDIWGNCRMEGQCRRLGDAELGQMRGGFSFITALGSIELSFGITQVVYVNNELVAVTQLVLPNLAQAIGTAKLSAPQIQALSAALGIFPSARAAVSDSASASARPGAASMSNPSTQEGGTAVVAAGSVANSINAAPSQVTSTMPRNSAASAVLVNGKPVVPGSPVVNPVGASAPGVAVIQNGPGNLSLLPNAADLRAAVGTMVIQNTLNNQTISALTVMNVSMNATSAINAVNIQQAVRQAIANSLR
jgi:hypothetical protein